MQVTVEDGEGLTRRMTVELPADDVEREVDKRLRDVARQARLPGFRPGKIPLRVLRQRFGEGVRGEVLGEMLEKTFQQAVTEQSLHPAGRPEIEPEIDVAKRRYAYTAKFEVLPEIELQDLAGKRILRPVCELTEADIDAVVERMRDQRKTFVDVERAAENGDRITISFQGTLDGEPFDGGSAEHRPFVLGSSGLIPGFEEQLVGASAGDEREVAVTFPDDYHGEKLAGRPAVFKVQVEVVAETRLPELDADFMAEFGVADGDMDRFRADVRGNLEREREQRVKSRLRDQVMDALIEANPLEPPQALVAQEIQSLREQTSQGGKLDTSILPDELFVEQAQRRVKLGLLIAEVVKRHGLSPSPERVRELVEMLASTYETPQEVIDYYYADPQRLSSVEAMAMEESVVERMLDGAEVVDESISFDALTEQTVG